jgi:hypothetical protein
MTLLQLLLHPYSLTVLAILDNSNNPKDQSELFKSYFDSQFSEPSWNEIDISYDNNANFSKHVDHCGVLKLLSYIDSNKVQGPDGIHGIILKSCELSTNFSDLFG